MVCPTQPHQRLSQNPALFHQRLERTGGQAASPACPPGAFSVGDLQDRLDAGKHRFQFNAERVAEFAHRDINGDGEDRLDNLRLGEMRMQPVPQILGQAVGVDADLHGQVEQRLFRIAKMRAVLVAVVADVVDLVARNAEPL